jgi:hypothetical protein
VQVLLHERHHLPQPVQAAGQRGGGEEGGERLEEPPRSGDPASRAHPDYGRGRGAGPAPRRRGWPGGGAGQALGRGLVDGAGSAQLGQQPIELADDVVTASRPRRSWSSVRPDQPEGRRRTRAGRAGGGSGRGQAAPPRWLSTLRPHGSSVNPSPSSVNFIHCL